MPTKTGNASSHTSMQQSQNKRITFFNSYMILLLLWYVSLLKYYWTDGSAWHTPRCKTMPPDPCYTSGQNLHVRPQSACKTPTCMWGPNLTGPT